MSTSVPVKVAVAVATLLVLAVIGLAAAWMFHPAWTRCASEVDGRVVEHECGDAPR